jgi:hypothetical protein
VEDEERCQQGKGGPIFLGAGFKTWEELYKNKISTEEGLSRSLRSKQRDLKQDEGDFMEQKILFNDLAKLLRLKLKLTTQQSNQGVVRTGAGESMSFGGGGGGTYAPLSSFHVFPVLCLFFGAFFWGGGSIFALVFRLSVRPFLLSCCRYESMGQTNVMTLED